VTGEKKEEKSGPECIDICTWKRGVPGPRNEGVIFLKKRKKKRKGPPCADCLGKEIQE